ncbi:MAG: Holliday junction resolvase RuvX [Acidimicrobiales bacterium]
MLALDLGERRIGVAVSDSQGVLASPYTVIDRGDDVAADHARVAALVEETGAELLVVGMPLSLSGASGPAAQKAQAEAEVLAVLVRVPVETFDERLTTVEAARRRQARLSAGVRPSRSNRKAGREGIDAEAAAILLEAWLDAHRGGQ